MNPISALTPRDAAGHQFVVYADCCSGRKGTQREKNFAAVNQVLSRLSPQPDFICFPGDHIAYETPKDYASLRAQWDYWLHTEMAWLDRKVTIYHTTSNHNTYDEGSEKIWREVFPDIPRNGPEDQMGLSYYIRRRDLLLVCANTSFSGLGGYGHVESTWLDRVLAENRDATYKFVAGHHPVYPVNGYSWYPPWRIVPDEGEAFWKVLVRHKVRAYLCSHVIAFDVQVHDGVMQITTGGAGTEYGPGGAMPGRTEYFHAVQMSVDRLGLRYQVLDTSGKVRESLDWPLTIPSAAQWRSLDVKNVAQQLRDSGQAASRSQLWAWRFSGELRNSNSDGESQTFLCGWKGAEAVPSIWVGVEGCPPRLIVRLLTESGGGEQTWAGTSFVPGTGFNFQLALHASMGPGGVLYRRNETSPWTSLESSSAKGAEDLIWPSNWSIGCSQSGSLDRPFRGKDLSIAWIQGSSLIPSR